MKKGILLLALLAGGLVIMGTSASLLAEEINPVQSRVTDIEPQQTTVSEPSSLAILGIGLLGLGLIARRRK